MLLLALKDLLKQIKSNPTDSSGLQFTYQNCYV